MRSVGDVCVQRDAVRFNSLPWALWSYLVIGLVALLPRVLDLGRWLSGDEASFWITRSTIFLDALRSGDYAATAISTHPGVTTMWLGSIGLLLRSALEQVGLLSNSSFEQFLVLMRLPTVLTHVAGVLVGYALLRRLFPPAVAGLAALLWACDPFVIAYSRVLHVDALAGTFLTISMLAACVYWHHEPRWRWLALSAVTAGLGVLSKSPALAVLPVVGLLAWRASGGKRWRTVLGPLALWGLLCGLTVFALWPALWTGPLRTLQLVQLGVEGEGAVPHMLGNFFLGREDDAPGALFYPVALALRLTPWGLVGLLALAWVWREARSAEQRTLAALAVLVLVFLAAMSIFPKKFNRYLVPIFPAIDIIAAYGLMALGQALAGAQRVWARLARPLLDGVAIAALANVVWWHPYEIAAFNQVLGGAAAGPQTFSVGWGEGLSEAAAWLNAQPDITGVRVATTMITALQPYLRQGAQAVIPDTAALPQDTGYVLVYLRNVQWGVPWAPFDEYIRHETPAHVVRIHGIDYAWIYQTPPKVQQQRAVEFGPAIQLYGYTQTRPATPGQPLSFELVWKVHQRPAADLMLFAHLLDADGRRYAQVDLPYPTAGWQPGCYQRTELLLPLPADLPPGPYRLTVGLYAPGTGQRLGVRGAAIDPALDGPDALVLDELEIK
ncbi:MAG TPA: glycosyltransferase family 39 protein [Roseiflexaceae bacterium]|nr:glycosyltransferase family 39 protein [Roseiflexaceae bacterium]